VSHDIAAHLLTICFRTRGSANWSERGRKLHVMQLTKDGLAQRSPKSSLRARSGPQRGPIRPASVP